MEERQLLKIQEEKNSSNWIQVKKPRVIVCTRLAKIPHRKPGTTTTERISIGHLILWVVRAFRAHGTRRMAHVHNIMQNVVSRAFCIMYRPAKTVWWQCEKMQFEKIAHKHRRHFLIVRKRVHWAVCLLNSAIFMALFDKAGDLAGVPHCFYTVEGLWNSVLVRAMGEFTNCTDSHEQITIWKAFLNTLTTGTNLIWISNFWFRWRKHFPIRSVFGHVLPATLSRLTPIRCRIDCPRPTRIQMSRRVVLISMWVHFINAIAQKSLLPKFKFKAVTWT